MKKVTFTYTRENLNTPWYWQVPAGLGSTAFKDYLTQNSDKIQQFGSIEEDGFKNIVNLTFSDDQSYQDFAAMINSDITPGYAEYCESNNITVEVVTEDI